MTYYKKFDSGLRLIVKKIEGLWSVSTGIIVGTGSTFETDGENGISHFIEHMMFKGTDKRTAFEISDAMDRIGAQVNAFTSKEITCYYSKSTSDHAGEAFEILSDFFLNSVFPEDEMEREKGVVLEEISMTEDTPDDLCFDVLAQAFYGNRGYGRSILGPAKNVSSFTRENLLEYIQKRYAPENIVISFAGNIDEKYAEELVETYIESKIPKRKREDRKPEIFYPSQSLFKKKDIEQVHFALAFPSFRRDDKMLDAGNLMNYVLGGGMSSRLFQKVREQLGLAYSVYSYISAYTECGSLIVYAGVNPQSAEKAFAAVRGEISRLCKDGITEEELVRGSEQLRSSLILGQESTASQMLVYGKHLLFTDEIFDFDARISAIDTLTRDDVARAIDVSFREEKMAAGAVGKLDKPFLLH